jgi:hypothetical protein
VDTGWRCHVAVVSGVGSLRPKSSANEPTTHQFRTASRRKSDDVEHVASASAGSLLCLVQHAARPLPGTGKCSHRAGLGLPLRGARRTDVVKRLVATRYRDLACYSRNKVIPPIWQSQRPFCSGEAMPPINGVCMNQLWRISAALLLCVASQISTPCQAQNQPSRNTAPLRGTDATSNNQAPPIPPSGFWAYCSVPRGICLVQGNAPIAPGSDCHCGTSPGQTW